MPHFIVSSRPAVMIVKNKYLHDSWVLFNSSVFMFCYVCTSQNRATTLMNSHSNIEVNVALRVIIDCTKIQVKIVRKIGTSFKQVVLFFPINNNSQKKKSHLMQLTFVLIIPYFCLVVFGILVTLAAWFSFCFFPSCPSYLAKRKQRLRNIFIVKSDQKPKRKMGWTKQKTIYNKEGSSWKC